MKNLLLYVVCSVVFFAFGYVVSSRALLKAEFSEVTSESISGPFVERSSLYVLARQHDYEKLEKLLETLVSGDIVAMKMAGFSETRNSEKICAQLKRLKESANAEAVFNNDLMDAMHMCT